MFPMLNTETSNYCQFGLMDPKPEKNICAGCMKPKTESGGCPFVREVRCCGWQRCIKLSIKASIKTSISAYKTSVTV